MEWTSWVWIGFILFNSILDLFKKKISLVSCGIGILLGGCFFVYQSLGNRESSGMEIIMQLIFRLLPGLLVMGIIVLSCQAIGMGDGCVLLVTGIFWGTSITIEICLRCRRKPPQTSDKQGRLPPGAAF